MLHPPPFHHRPVWKAWAATNMSLRRTAVPINIDILKCRLLDHAVWFLLFFTLIYPTPSRYIPTGPLSQAVPVPLRDGGGSAWSYGRERGGYGYASSPTSRSNKVGVFMRAGKAGRGRRVEIEGAGGETRRVQRRSRKPDLRSMRRIGLQVCEVLRVRLFR